MPATRSLAAAALLIAVSCVHLEPPPPLHGEVVRVVDGDTIHVRVDGERLRVRLIGIDTPETSHPREPDGCYGPEASAELRSLLLEQEVELVRDLEPEDRFDRTLAYVYRARDGLFVNHHMVRRGFARVLSIQPNVRHVVGFVLAERAARAERLGFWAACP